MHVRIVEARHDELFVQLYVIDAAFASAAFSHDLGNCADADDFSITDGHARGPGMLRVIGVNAAMKI
jgi:hypothetical protein